MQAFDSVYCIHLPDVERYKAICAEFDRVGIRSVEFVHAAAPHSKFTVPNMRRNPRAEFGVGLSHLQAIANAMADGAKRPLFVEDDIQFIGRIPEELPDYDVLYLGGHPREKATLVAPRIAKVGKFSCAEAYSIRGELLRDFHQYWCDRITQPDAMYDFILGEFAAKHRAYCVYPVITQQAAVVSHVRGEIDDKRALIARGWKNNLAV